MPSEDDQDSATLAPQVIDLALTKTVDRPEPDIGQHVTFTIRLRNDGPDTATGVAVRDTLPTGMTFVSASAGQGSYSAATGIWTVGVVPSGAAIRLDLTGKVTAAGVKTNTAQVTAADQFDIDSTWRNAGHC